MPLPCVILCRAGDQGEAEGRHGGARVGRGLPGGALQQGEVAWEAAPRNHGSSREGEGYVGGAQGLRG